MSNQMYNTKTALRAAKVEMVKIAKCIDEAALFTEDNEYFDLCVRFDELRENLLSNVRFLANKPVHFFWTKEGEKYVALAELARELDDKLFQQIGEEKVRAIQLAAHYDEVIVAEREAEEAEWNEICEEAEALGLVRNEEYVGDGDALFVEPEAEEEEDDAEAVEAEAEESTAETVEAEAEESAVEGGATQALEAKTRLEAEGRFSFDTRNELRKMSTDYAEGIEGLGGWVANVYLFADGSICGERHDFESREFVHVLVGKDEAAFRKVWKYADNHPFFSAGRAEPLISRILRAGEAEGAAEAKEGTTATAETTGGKDAGKALLEEETTTADGEAPQGDKQEPRTATATGAKKKEAPYERREERGGREAERHGEGPNEARLLPVQAGDLRGRKGEGRSRGHDARKGGSEAYRRIRIRTYKGEIVLRARSLLA